MSETVQDIVEGWLAAHGPDTFTVDEMLERMPNSELLFHISRAIEQRLEQHLSEGAAL